ncbi:hypothetical protein [Peterkaempfera bronchialis]|uniref:Uncharacterized protein n=1 Tax=Peterkaempfera bronchialis TaxID=2126346 RepID=A0A345T2C3_9ACTN|nr:hypothetical protein [Peterkaempfera bronchialis]AXI80128.1 hypothetical protein C7M71_024745 [Peterkaempfera bronchialis]
MPRMLDVSDEVRAEIGDDEADRLLAGGHAPDTYDCTSCRTPGDSLREQTSTVLFMGEETAVLAFAHARCIPSQVVPVTEEQLRGAMRSINGGQQGTQPQDRQQVQPHPQQHQQHQLHQRSVAASASVPGGAQGDGSQPAVLSITCGLVLVGDTPHAALVVEPTVPVGRPGSTSGQDEFLHLLLEHGFGTVKDVDRAPAPLAGWSVLMALGQLHAVLQPAPHGGTVAWWQAHQPLQVTDTWRAAASRQAQVYMYAAPVGTIGSQPREDLLRQALDRAAAQGVLAGAVLPLAGT